MKKQKAKRSTTATITIIAILLVFFIGITIAFLTDLRTTLNILGIGGNQNQRAVQIALYEKAFGEYENAITVPLHDDDLNLNGEYEQVILNNLLPGDKVNKDSIVANVGIEDIYVRIKLTDKNGDVIDDERKEEAPYKFIEFTVDTDVWEYDAKTEYYYYTGGAEDKMCLALSSDERVAVYNSRLDGENEYTIAIVDEIGSTDLEALEEAINMNIQVEAIQVRNFNPTAVDGENDPWDGANIQAIINRPI